MPKKSSYSRKDGPRTLKNGPGKKPAHTSVTMQQVVETSTATGQKIPSMAIPMSAVTKTDPNQNDDPKNAMNGRSSYTPKGGPYGGL